SVYDDSDGVFSARLARGTRAGSRDPWAVDEEYPQGGTAMPSERLSQYTALVDDIQAFRNYIHAERGLAGNTLLAYGRDLDRFSQWVAGGGLSAYLHPSLRDLS